MILKKIENLLLLVFLFLLPWQTRYIWRDGQLSGGHWEYGTFSIYGVEILLWIIILLFFFRHLFDKRIRTEFLTQKKLFFLPLIFLGLMGLSFGFSENFWVSYQYVFRWLGAMAFFVILSQARNLFNNLLGSLWMGGVAQGLLAVYQFFTQHVWANKWLGIAVQDAMQGGASVVEFADERWLRAYGSFGSPNSLGIYLAVLLVLGFVLYLRTERPIYKILISAGQLIILSGLLFSFSRGAWLSAMVGIIGLAIIIFFTRCHSEQGEESLSNHLSFRPKWRDPLNTIFAKAMDKGSLDSATAPLGMTVRKDFIKQIFFILVLTGFWLGIFFPIFSARFNLHNRLEVYSIAERQSQYKESLFFIKQNPWLGVGPGLYTFAVSEKYPKLTSWQFQPVHNIYVLAVVEFGILFVIFLGLIIFSLIRKVFKNNLIFLPVLLALLVAGLFDHWLFSMFTGLILFWTIGALAYKQTDS